MTVIKNRQADRLLNEAIVLDLGDLHQQGEAILERARAEAKQIKQRGQAEADQLVAEASDKGYQQGYDKGLAEGRSVGEQSAREETIAEYRQKLDQLLENWQAAVSQWDADRQHLLMQGREEVLTLAMAIAEKVVYRVVDIDPTVIQDQVAEALQLITRPSSVAVTIHPDDRPAVEDVLPELLQNIRQCREATLVEDPSMTRGGCVVSTEGGQIDARIEQQIDRIVDTLLPTGTNETEAAKTVGDEALAIDPDSNVAEPPAEKDESARDQS